MALLVGAIAAPYRRQVRGADRQGGPSAADRARRNRR